MSYLMIFILVFLVFPQTQGNLIFRACESDKDDSNMKMLKSEIVGLLRKYYKQECYNGRWIYPMTIHGQPYCQCFPAYYGTNCQCKNLAMTRNEIISDARFALPSGIALKIMRTLMRKPGLGNIKPIDFFLSLTRHHYRSRITSQTSLSTTINWEPTTSFSAPGQFHDKLQTTTHTPTTTQTSTGSSELKSYTPSDDNRPIKHKKTTANNYVDVKAGLFESIAHTGSYKSITTIKISQRNSYTTSNYDPSITSSTVTTSSYDPSFTSSPATTSSYDPSITSSTTSSYDPSITSSTVTISRYDPSITSSPLTSSGYDPSITSSTTSSHDPSITSSTTSSHDPSFTSSTTSSYDLSFTSSTTSSYDPSITSSTTSSHDPSFTSSTTSSYDPSITSSTTSSHDPSFTSSTTSSYDLSFTSSTTSSYDPSTDSYAATNRPLSSVSSRLKTEPTLDGHWLQRHTIHVPTIDTDSDGHNEVNENPSLTVSFETKQQEDVLQQNENKSRVKRKRGKKNRRKKKGVIRKIQELFLEAWKKFREN